MYILVRRTNAYKTSLKLSSPRNKLVSKRTDHTVIVFVELKVIEKEGNSGAITSHKSNGLIGFQKAFDRVGTSTCGRFYREGIS